MKVIALLIALFLPDTKEDKINISKSYDIVNPDSFTVMVDNIFGDVIIEPSNDSKVYLELQIEILGRTDDLIELAKKELTLGERFNEDSLILYPEAPFIKRWRGKGLWHNSNKDPEYKYRYQYKLKIPKSTGIYAATVDKGDVLIKNLDGIVKASNVNGEVDIINARDVRKASTVNGDVTISLLESPKSSVDFNTVNGDFRFQLPDDFSAKIYFDSMNGDLYSAFDYTNLRPKVEKSEKEGRFKIGTKTGVEIGSSGPEFSFTSINGDVYLRKSSTQN